MFNLINAYEEERLTPCDLIDNSIIKIAKGQLSLKTEILKNAIQAKCGSNLIERVYLHSKIKSCASKVQLRAILEV